MGLNLIPFRIIATVGPGPGNAAYEFNEALRRVHETAVTASTEFEKWAERVFGAPNGPS